MSRVLFDTSAMSELFRGHEGIAQTIAFADQIGVSPVALGELKASFRGGTRYEKNQAGLQRFLCKPLVRALRTDAETADRYAQIHDSLRRAGNTDTDQRHLDRRQCHAVRSPARHHRSTLRERRSGCPRASRGLAGTSLDISTPDCELRRREAKRVDEIDHAEERDHYRRRRPSTPHRREDQRVHEQDPQTGGGGCRQRATELTRDECGWTAERLQR